MRRRRRRHQQHAARHEAGGDASPCSKQQHTKLSIHRRHVPVGQAVAVRVGQRHHQREAIRRSYHVPDVCQ
eukprot:173676-Chlamydomonas_euryale.AAC.1